MHDERAGHFNERKRMAIRKLQEETNADSTLSVESMDTKTKYRVNEDAEEGCMGKAPRSIEASLTNPS